MRTETFIRHTRIEAPAEAVYDWHTRPGAFERLVPPWEPVEVIQRHGGIRDGDRILLRTRFGPFRPRWMAEHRDHVPGRRFCDVQTTGPFARWEHTHLIEPDGPDACRLEDRIEYALPMGGIGRMLAGSFVRRRLERAFAYRHRTLAGDLAALATRRGAAPMTVLVTGSRGLVGSALIPFLTAGGDRVIRLVRAPAEPGEGEARLESSGALGGSGLEGIDAVVHLAGENIAARRWSSAQKARIRESRVRGTRILCESLARLPNPPRTLVCASAIGYYGNRGDEELREESGPGTGFLPEVCLEWEEATRPALEAGIRVVNVRFGAILSASGGALAKMLLPFRMGLGGVLGDGTQAMSWISLDDAIGAIHHALWNEGIRGPVNGTAPNPVTNREFTKVLGRVLARPTLLPAPGFAIRLAFGELAEALLLASARVLPGRLLATGYAFRDPDLEGALRHLLGR